MMGGARKPVSGDWLVGELPGLENVEKPGLELGHGDDGEAGNHSCSWRSGKMTGMRSWTGAMTSLAFVVRIAKLKRS